MKRGQQGWLFAWVVLIWVFVFTGCGTKFKALSYSQPQKNTEPPTGSITMPTDPSAQITRRHVAILIADSFKLSLQSSNSEEVFADIPRAELGGREAEALLREGLTAGCQAPSAVSNNKSLFCPNQIVPLWQFLIQVGRGLPKFQKTRISYFDARARGSETFGADASRISELNPEALGYTQMAVDYGFIEKTCGSSCLSQFLTLGKAREILQRATITSAQTKPVTANAKVFFKNVVEVSGQAAGYTVRRSGGQWTCQPSTLLNLDAYLSDVILSGTTGDELRNSDILVSPQVNTLSICGDDICTNQQSAGTRVRKQDGKWMPANYSTATDSAHALGQVMAYHWINQIKILAEGVLPGSWHARQKGVEVYSRCYDLKTDPVALQYLGWNAFWSGSSGKMVCMGFLENAEAAFDASVYVHEMGHANVDFGTNGQISQNSSDVQCPGGLSAQCCPSADGCSGAINEGQADYHAFAMFNSPKLGEGFMNTISGFGERAGDRTTRRTAQEMFAYTSGSLPIGKEIHYMGGVWGAAWWTLRQRLGGPLADRIFFAHVPLLTGSDTFRTALNKVLVARGQVLPERSDIDAILRSVFAEHGITPP